MKLDYKLKSIEERKELVEKILEENPNPPERYLEILSDYLVFCMDKEERKEKKILTPNHLATIQKRETSYQSLLEQFENGEDGLYHLFNDDKTIIFKPKKVITKQDLIDIPQLAELREAIKRTEAKLNTMPYGKDRYIVKQMLIDMRKNQYVIKDAFKPPLGCVPSFRSKSYTPLDGRMWVDENEEVRSEGITLANPEIVSTILKYYSKLKASAVGQFTADTYYLLLDFEDTVDRALANYPLYLTIVELKIDGLQNTQIQERLLEQYGETYTPEYISTLYNKKIPKLIAEQAELDCLDHHFMENARGHYKKCNRCGQIKLAHPKFFSKNSTSRDGWYSICKSCRKEGYKHGRKC